jgi:hypothetical protein
MNEGWCGEDYLILFAEWEVASASERYSITQILPSYQVMGLRGWDDFILRDPIGGLHLMPTVPVDPQHFTPFALPEGAAALQVDERFRGKIKWYLKPLALGGDASAGENLTWVSHEQHAQLVRWWNDRIREMKSQSPATEAG